MSETFLMGLSVGQNVGMNVIILLIIMGIGYLLGKKGLITDVGIKQLNNILLYGVIPSVIINAYQRDFDIKMLKELGISIFFVFVLHFVLSFILPFFFRDDPLGHNKIHRFAVVYSNCGFMGFPIIQAVYGNTGMFYAVGYLTVFNLMYWTLGAYSYTRDKKTISLKNVIINPGVLSTLIGLTLFLLRIRLPEFIIKTNDYVASLNTPLPMIIIGACMVGLDFKKVFKNKYMWIVCGLRLLIVPILAILLADLVGLTGEIKMTLIIASACPIAVVTTLFAAKHNLDYQYSSELVSVSNILAVITLPIVSILATIF